MAKTETQPGAGILADPDPAPSPLTLEELRAKFFEPEKAKPAPVPMTWNGINFEWRQPTIQQTQDAQDQEGKNFMVLLLIAHSYMLGSEIKLFTDADYEMLVQMPLNGEFQNIVRQISDRMDLKVEEKAKK